MSGCATSHMSETAQTDMRTVPASSRSLPDHIVNGDFEYPTIPSDKWIDWGWPDFTAYGSHKHFVTINPDKGAIGTGLKTGNGMYPPFNNAPDMSVSISGFDRSMFGWSSTQQEDDRFLAHNVELNYDAKTHNQLGEIVADQAGTAIYQDISTEPGTIYTWTLKHTSTASGSDDGMQVMIGAPGAESPQDATRTVSQNGNQIGWHGTDIVTHTTSDDPSVKKWDTYTGVYEIPAGQTVTRFTFKSIQGSSRFSGNNVDDISFQISRPLTYDPNGGSGTVPRQ